MSRFHHAGLALAMGMASLSCGHKSEVPPPETEVSISPLKAGEISDPQESFAPLTEVDARIAKVKSKIAHIATPDEIKKIHDSCEQNVDALYCLIDESKHTLDQLQSYSDAFQSCFQGSRRLDGEPDMTKGGTIDLNCFFNGMTGLSLKSDFAFNREVLRCHTNLLNCYTTGYKSLKVR